METSDRKYLIWTHSDGDVAVPGPIKLWQVIEDQALTGDVGLRDGQDASGALLLTLTASMDFPGVKLHNGLFIDDNATAGRLVVIYSQAMP